MPGGHYSPVAVLGMLSGQPGAQQYPMAMQQMRCGGRWCVKLLVKHMQT